MTVFRLPVDFDRTEPLVAGANGTGCEGVLLVQIGNFAVLRRRLGRARAETLILEIAAALPTLVPGTCPKVVAHDLIELGVVSESRTMVEFAIGEVEAAFGRPFVVNGEPFHLDLVLGAAVMSAGDGQDTRLIEEAEQALSEARTERVPVVRDVTCRTASIDRIALSRDLAGAISSGEMFLHYQPKLQLRSQEISSVEALIRWQHPDRGLISPADFIPIAEESRDIVALTLWTIRQVIADQKTMAQRGNDLRVFINIAAGLLSDPCFVQRACGLVEAGGTNIGFEITETSVIRDPDSAIMHLKMFAGMGIEIAIDDYGAGLSSLAYLKKLPARELKIDKMFVTQLASSNRDPLIVRSTIDLAHALEMKVVAEGVETHSALALLSVMGCDMVQGYLISRPLALAELLDFLQEHRRAQVSQACDDRVVPFQQLATAWKRA